MGFFGPPNVEKMASKGDIEGLIEALNYEKDSLIRLAAAHALGKMKDDKSVVYLIKHTEDRDDKVSKACIEALGSLGKSMGHHLIIPALIASIEKNRFPKECAAALLQYGGDVALKASLDLFQNKIASNNARRIGLETLLQLNDENIVNNLIKSLSVENNLNLYIDVLKALGDLHDSRAILPVVNFLQFTFAGKLEEIWDRPKFDKNNFTVVQLRKLDPNYKREIQETAISTLFKLGNLDVFKKLPLIFEDNNMCLLVCAELDKAGWQPDHSEMAAYYWIWKNQFESCIALGSTAVKPLICALPYSSKIDHKLRLDCLVKIGEPAVEYLSSFVYEKKYGSYRELAFEALRLIDAQKAEELGKDLLTTDTFRQEDFWLMVHQGGPWVLQALIKHIIESDLETCEAVHEGMLRILRLYAGEIETIILQQLVLIEDKQEESIEQSGDMYGGVTHYVIFEDIRLLAKEELQKR